MKMAKLVNREIFYFSTPRLLGPPTGIAETLNEEYYKFLLDKNSGEQSLSLKCMPPLGHHIVEKIKPEITLCAREVALKVIWHCSLYIGIKKVADWPEIQGYAALRDEFGGLGDLGTDEDKIVGDFLRDFGFKGLGGFKQFGFFYGEEPRKLLTTVLETLGELRMVVATIACFAAWADEDCLAEETKRECKEIVDRFRSRVRLRHRMGRSGVDYLLEVKEKRARHS
jgi:hypothetical protein